MSEIFQIAGSIAGIGGLALVVFLYLFRRIQLPQGTRHHLTLFMWLVWSICFVCIGGYFFENIYRSKENITTRWTTEIQITHPSNEKFIEFLEKNLGKTIYLATSLDMSLVGKDSNDIADSFGDGESKNGARGIDSFSEDSSTRLPLEGIMSIHNLELELLAKRTLQPSFGGTGVIQFPIIGYFKVTKHREAGPTVIWVLTEIPFQISESAK